MKLVERVWRMTLFLFCWDSGGKDCCESVGEQRMRLTACLLRKSDGTSDLERTGEARGQGTLLIPTHLLHLTKGARKAR